MYAFTAVRILVYSNISKFSVPAVLVDVDGNFIINIEELKKMKSRCLQYIGCGNLWQECRLKLHNRDKWACRAIQLIGVIKC